MDNPRPDLFNDRRSEGKRMTPTTYRPSAAESYLKGGVDEASKMRAAATNAESMRKRQNARAAASRARRAGNADQP